MAATKMKENALPLLACGLAAAALAILAISGLGTRIGLWDFRTGFAMLRYGAWCGFAAAAVSILGAAISIRKRRFLGIIITVCSLAAGTTAFVVPVRWELAARKVPRIHDITTDVADPPAFVALLPLRQGATNSPVYGGAAVGILQLQAYPDIKTAILDMPSQQAFEHALDTARRMGWKTAAAVPAEGRIEATDTTFWFGFTDDIVIRVTPAGNRSLVDIRSLSRVGVSDVGTNAQRIRQFLKNLTGR